MSAVFRFAPSPNGRLHLGHAYCALLNQRLARESGGTLLLRLEDIDAARCTRVLATCVRDDLHWLGLVSAEPVRRQSAHLAAYRAVQTRLGEEGLLYPCFCTRGDIARAVEAHPHWPRDPDGAPLYPGTCRALPESERRHRLACEPHAWRLDMNAACARTGALTWIEDDGGPGRCVPADPKAWGDVVLARKDIGTSYHVAVVADDADQGITHVVRGQDLFAATAIHRVLQVLLGLPAPRYRHHALLRDAHGDKLAKSRVSTPLADMRAAGTTAEQLRLLLGFAA